MIKSLNLSVNKIESSSQKLKSHDSTKEINLLLLLSFMHLYLTLFVEEELRGERSRLTMQERWSEIEIDKNCRRRGSDRGVGPDMV